MFAAPSSQWLTDSSPLKLLISRAINPHYPEPNDAANLEIAEYINQKKANTPREAATTIAQLVNHRNPHIAMLALNLLDVLVKSCGYPFHLQISTKEFLNELVRRFPERPPPFPGPVMSRILELIHGWKEGICTDSRWKEDLGNIRDMHRLLTFKGYRFRDVPRHQTTSTATASTSNLKTAEELENEDREAQSAKLQELIRRGTPRDLAQAQELMKALAGANPDSKPDYRTQALTELNKLESKVILLNELLDNFDVSRAEQFAQGDAYDQVASILSAARPKIQGWISNAQEDDPESLDTFLQINDQINTVLGRYDAFKKGDYSAAVNPIPSELSSSRTQNDLSLIDFDESASSAPTGATTINELESLFGPSSSAPAPTPASALYTQPQQPVAMGGLSGLGFNTASPPSYGSAQQPNYNASSMGNQSSQRIGATTSPQYNSPVGTPMGGMQQGPIRLGTPSLPAHNGNGARVGSQSPNYFGNTMGTASPMAAMSTMSGGAPLTPGRPPQQPQTQQTTTSTQAQGKDPFADLAGLF